MALSRNVVMLTLCLVLCGMSVGVHGQTPNVLNDDNTITWGDFADDKPYKTTDYVADDGGLDPYYALAKSFIDSSLPEQLPLAKTKDLMDGKIDMATAAQEIALDFIGFMICFAIGLLFIFIFPIVALCFCCCRCCGNCGGKRLQKHDDNAKCKRLVFSAILFVLAAFVVAGAACTFVTNDQFSKNLGGLNESFSDSIDDVQSFVDNINTQFKRIGDTNFLFIRSVLVNYVGNASTEISERLIADLNKAVGLDEPLAKIEDDRKTALAQTEQLQNKVDQLEDERDTAVAALTPINTGCSNCIDADLTYLNGINFANMRTTLDTFKDKVSTNVFNEMKGKMDGKIKNNVDQATTGINVESELDDIYNNQIKPLLDQVDKLQSNTNSDLDSYKETVGNFESTVKPYDKFRWYAGVGLAAFLMLIAVLMLVGIVLGLLCGSANAKPTERGAASNCGGIMLMAAVGLIFIFGALLMLLTTLMYLFGSLTERYVCQTVDDLGKIEEYTSALGMGMDLKNISFDLNGNQISLGLTKLMDGCEKGQTLYKVLGLEAVVDDSLQKIEDYKNDLDITNKMGNTAGSATGNIDVDGEVQKLQQAVNDIATLETTISTMRGALQTSQAHVNTETSSTAGDTYIGPMVTTTTEMETITGNLKGTADNIKTEADKLPALITDAEAKLGDSTFTGELVDNVTSDYVGTLFSFVDSYIADVKDKLENNVAKCTPVHSIFNAIFSEAVCHGIVDPLNGFWLALGWCIFFFMPGLIFAVKLAKHFRRMLYEDSYGAPTTEEAGAPPPYSTEASAGKGETLPPLFPPANGNKVAPF